MPVRSLSAQLTKIYQFVFGLVIVAIGMYAVNSAVSGSQGKLKLLAAGLAGAALILALERYYWVLSAFLLGFYDLIPKVKFTGAELGALILVGTFFVRMALRRDPVAEKRSPVVFSMLPFLIWMLIVWSQYPTGMLIFGSGTIGGRFYFKVILAFLAAMCLSAMKFDEGDCKRLCFAIASGYTAFVLKNVMFGSSESLMGSGVHYSYNHLAFVAPLFLCRFTTPELLGRFWPLAGFLLTFGLSVYSGHRSSMARQSLIGLMAPFFLRRDRFKTMMLALVASIPLVVAVAGQGTLWRLPFSIQRSLSFLPAKWDSRLEDYGFRDTFRATLRIYAREHIAASPWVGDGGFALNMSSMAWATSGNAIRDGYSSHVLARNWHNVWLGMAADFGIPLSVFWALFMACLLVFGWNGLKFLPPGSWNQTMYLYFYLFIIVEFINSFFNGGHTALTAQQFFYWAGWMSAVLNGAREKTGQVPPVPVAGSAF